MFRMFEGSQHARLYAQFRPDPPAPLLERVLEFVRRSAPLQRAVDVGCGTGQNSRLLAAHFDSVLATDISPSQVAEAAAAGSCDNISYQAAPAEQIPAPDGSVHLITASVCFHFFDRAAFLAEVDRVLAPGGVVAAYSYQLPYACLADGAVWTEFTSVLREASDVHLSSYWVLPTRDAKGGAREAMAMIPYPDKVWDETSFFTERPLSVEYVLGEMASWSAFQNMVTSRGAAEGDELLRRTGGRLRAVVADGGRRGVDVAGATERRQWYMWLARKPAAE